MNRIKCIRMYHGLSQTAFGNLFGVDQTAVSNWEKGKNSIDIKIVEKISQHFSLPMDFIYGTPFELSCHKSSWHKSQIEDYINAPSEIKDYLLFKYGKGVFHSVPEEEKSTESLLAEEDIVIYHYNGKTGKKKLTKEQMAMVYAMLEAMPDTPTDF